MRSSFRDRSARICCSCWRGRRMKSAWQWCGRRRWTACWARPDKGLDTIIGGGGVKVSGGEKQRLSIARALLRKPQLLVFDHATSALDSLTEEEISQTI